MRDGTGQKTGGVIRGDYCSIELLPKTDFLIRMRQLNPLGDAPEYIERLQKTCLKASHLPFLKKLETLETYSTVKLQLNLNCNSMLIYKSISEADLGLLQHPRWSSL